MPRFNGDNPRGWLFKAKQFFQCYNSSEDQKFLIAPVYMDGPAFSWYQWMNLNKQLHSWPQFKEQVMQMFGDSLYRDFRGELAKLQQKITVQDFYNEFEELANQISGISPEFLQSYFESGLRQDIKREVRALQPSSLQQAFQLAKLMEDRIADYFHKLLESTKCQQ